MTDLTPADDDLPRLARRHLRAGWAGLLGFAALGLALESLHAVKSFSYLGVGQETRRLMWTLAHAHGVGLSLVQLGFAATLGLCPELPRARCRRAGRLLHGAFVLMPAGFLFGGFTTYGGDPGLLVLLVPLGGVLLMAALGVMAWSVMA